MYSENAILKKYRLYGLYILMIKKNALLSTNSFKLSFMKSIHPSIALRLIRCMGPTCVVFDNIVEKVIFANYKYSINPYLTAG